MALWVPVVWMFIVGSRLPSQWMGGQMGSAAEVLEEGNPLDRTIYVGLIVLAIGFLLSRSFPWGAFFLRNRALTAFLLFALVSVFWSDFPLTASKRWFRDFGNYLMVLVVLSDPLPMEAIRTFLRRLHFLLIPLSILLIKYYPRLAIQYSPWTGAPEYIGAASSKNTLGFLCMMSATFFVWDALTRWPDRNDSKRRRLILLDFAFIAMTVYLLRLSNSKTSTVCLIIGCLILLAAHSGWFRRHPAFLKLLIPGCFAAYLLFAYGFGLNGDLASEIGRDPTFTGRTTIWNAVLSTHTNPLFGTGYDSFWLGPRLQQVWNQTGPGINEAHNGYLDIYLNLGLVGLFFLSCLLISSYRTICRNLAPFSSLASLTAALFTIMFFYNMTEAALGAPTLCLTFLLGTLAVPRVTHSREIPVRQSSFAESDSRRQKGAIA